MVNYKHAVHEHSVYPYFGKYILCPINCAVTQAATKNTAKTTISMVIQFILKH